MSTGSTDPRTMFVRIWRFETSLENVAAFRAVYGPDGSWAALFRRARGYLGTELLQSVTAPGQFATIDRWTSREAWETFLAEFRDEYAAMDARCEHLTIAETEVGGYEVLHSR